MHTRLTKRYQTFFIWGQSSQSAKYSSRFTPDIKNGNGFKSTAIYISTLRYSGFYIICLYLQASEITNIRMTLDWYVVSRKTYAPQKSVAIQRTPISSPKYVLLSNLGSNCTIWWLKNIKNSNAAQCRSQWQRGLRRGSAAVRLLGLRVRITSGARLYVSVYCCVLSSRGHFVGLITHTDRSHRA